LTFSNCEKFFEWVSLQDYSNSHKTHILCYFRKHLQNRAFIDTFEFQKYITTKKIGLASIVLAGRAFLNYCAEFELYPIEVIEKYRKILKIKDNNPDVYCPSNDEVLKNYQLIKNHKSLDILYLVLTVSGIRLIEALKFLQTYQIERFIHHKNFVVYSVGETRNTKTINSIFLPTFVYNKLHHVSNSYQSLRMRLRKKGVKLGLKYLRKWQFNFCLYQGIPESICDYLQGRANHTIGSLHYMARQQQSEFWYAKIADKFKKIFACNNSNISKTVGVR